jgi:hypothetical protein
VSRTLLNSGPVRCARATCATVIVFYAALYGFAGAQTRVQDIFGRSLNERGITLVDWDGYMANPLITVYLLPPLNAALPGSASITADGARLYFNEPSRVSPNGPSATRSLTDAGKPIPLKLSIFPAHASRDGPYTLTIVFTDAQHARQTNTIPISVIEQETQRPTEFLVTANYNRDATHLFENPLARGIVNQAANDWSYFFAGMNLDRVPSAAEKTFIFHDNFAGGYTCQNTDAYTGYLLYAYGTQNTAHRSGGEASRGGGRQTSGGVALSLKRSGGFEANIDGNYNTLHWAFLTNDDDWLASANLGNESNDFYSIAHHEIGHALIFNPGHPGFAAVIAKGAFTSEAVQRYYGRPVPVDASCDHLTGVIDPESGQGAFGYEYYGEIPRFRWTMTKLDLLCAQEVGYTLRSNAAFAPLTFPRASAPDARIRVAYKQSLTATGGIPIYDWDITAGALPPGLSLDRFTGEISGTPEGVGVFHFTVRVRDYHEKSTGVSQDFTLTSR